ncbi:hypothetical protein Gohar_013721 [Gossypium harknessii]|uniref:Ribulose bisphosphate carboxylase large subunit C-terminal domain-containing protein n=1 Tax=Gossypium harknessii TaxID=34285 RepID=A0A7J9H1N4_9ROSI|nr:hypothetical protein [Gossypium harknessii]
MYFRILAKALYMFGGDHIYIGTVVGKLEGEKDITLGFVDLLRVDFIEKDRSCVFISPKIWFPCQDWCILFYLIYHGFESWIKLSITTSSTHPRCCPFGSMFE